MKIKLTAPITDIRGSIAGTTFKLGPYGLLAYSKQTGPRRRSPNQRRPTHQFSRLCDRWKHTLTHKQRNGWQHFATQSQLSTRGPHANPLSPLQAYLQTNLFRLQYDIPVLDDAPTPARILPPPQPLVSFLVSTYVKLDNTGDLPGAGEWFAVSMSRLLSPTAHNPRFWSRQLWLVTGPQVNDQFLLIRHPRIAGATFRVDVRIADNTSRFSTPFVFVGVL